MSEHSEQVKLIQWCSLHEKVCPPLWFIYSNANGAWTKNVGEARKLKREGLKRGVPDLTLPYPTKSFHGLYIEMKFGSNKPTVEQRLWLKRLALVGYKTLVAYSAIEASRSIIIYLNEICNFEIRKQPERMPCIIACNLINNRGEEENARRTESTNLS